MGPSMGDAVFLTDCAGQLVSVCPVDSCSVCTRPPAAIFVHTLPCRREIAAPVSTKYSTGMVLINTTIRKLAPHVADSVCKVTVLSGAFTCLPSYGWPVPLRDWSFPDALWSGFYTPGKCGLSHRSSNTPQVFAAFHLRSSLT